MNKKVRCPSCGAFTSFDKSNSFRPFCSERCQILDLGAWADEKYAIPAQESEISGVNQNPENRDQNSLSDSATPPKHQLN